MLTSRPGPILSDLALAGMVFLGRAGYEVEEEKILKITDLGKSDLLDLGPSNGA